MSEQTFTAARIAAALGKSPQAVRKLLPDSTAIQIVHGVEAAAWPVSKFPAHLLSRLQEIAREQRCRTVESMLLAERHRWEPELPFSQVHNEDITYAQKLREAFRPLLIQRNDLSVSSADLEKQALAGYTRVFGNTISGRYWRELFMRTLQRDGGAEDWNRLEIYLPNRLKQKESPSHVVLEAFADEFSDLAGYIAACSQPSTEIEERGIWTRAFEQYSKMLLSGIAPKKAARNMRDFLFAKAAFLAPSRDALLKSFQRKLSAWKRNGPSGLADGRQSNGDDFVFPQRDLDLIEAKIVFQFGEFAPAWREALIKRELSEATQKRYSHRVSRKSHVPEKLISALGKRPVWLYTLHRRRRDFNSMKAHFTTIYDGLKSLSCISADDVTLPVWFWHNPDPAQPPIITRGQCLVFIDLTSKRILGWSLQPDKNYNALVIYTQTTRVFAEVGVPKSLLFEHGIWEKSKIITGSAPFSVAEVTQGLKEFGIEFFHADTPQGKWEVEQVMGLIQNLMEGEPGYCGRDERRDRPDWIKQQLARIQSSADPAHPSRYLYSFEQWNTRLGKIFADYNATSQGGNLMRNRSPDQVFVENWDCEDPPIRLGPQLRYLLAHAKYEKTVEPSGITITSGNRKFKYFGPELGSLVGHRVLAWFNPEFPDVLTVTDMRRKNAIAVPLHDGVPRLEKLINPDGKALSEACERREGQVSGMLARYNVLKANHELPYRRNLVAAQVEALGAQIEAGRSAIIQTKAERRGRLDRAQGKARTLGIPTVLVGDDEETARGLELLAEAQREHTQDTKEET